MCQFPCRIIAVSDKKCLAIQLRCAEIRPVANYIAWAIEQHLATKSSKAREPRDADPSDERVAYDVGPRR